MEESGHHLKLLKYLPAGKFPPFNHHFLPSWLGLKMPEFRGAWPPRSVEHGTPDLEIVSSSPMWGIEITHK